MNLQPIIWSVVAVVAIIALFMYKTVIRVLGMVIIPNNGVGIVTKKFRLLGSNTVLPNGKIVALQGEAGIQADTLAPGLHFWLWPWQYTIQTVAFATVPDGKVGVVVARDGQPIPTGRVLARRVDCNTFQDARAFLTNGGQRGPQIAVMPPGTYRINTMLFSLQLADALEVHDGMVGIVTTKDGGTLPPGEIAGSTVEGHKSFQDGEAFIAAGGYKGLQEQVMLQGRYFVNPEFVTVEEQPLTVVPIAHAGVVIAYVGPKGDDVTGENFKHGNLVERGRKGVWIEPLDPGRYPINPYTHQVEIVPTANVVLNWATGKSEAHQLDKNLSTITVRSSDGFTFNLDVAQIIHIPRNDAPKVIARFGSMLNLVTQVLEPTIGNYFRNAAQQSDVIVFLKARSERQADARKQISSALEQYNVGAVDTLIGDITPPPELMKTLTDRKIAEQEQVTYDTQKQAQTIRQQLQQATALADTQARVVDSERSVQIAEFGASAVVKKAEGEAKAKKIVAEADANVVITVGTAEAEKIMKIGSSEASVIKQKGEAIDPANFVAIEVAKALAGSGQRLVPDIAITGGSGGDKASLIDVVLASIVKQGLQALPVKTSSASK